MEKKLQDVPLIYTQTGTHTGCYYTHFYLSVL